MTALITPRSAITTPPLPAKEGAAPSLSLFILAYNEETTLPATTGMAVEMLESEKKKRTIGQYEVILINDGSIDNTKNVCVSLAKKYPTVRVINHEHNKGFGGTQKTGYAAASHELVTYLPGDNQVRADAVQLMLPSITGTGAGADLVVGRRRKRMDSWKRRATAGLYNAGLRLMFGLRVHDVDGIKIIRKQVLDAVAIESESANVDVELLVRAKKKGFRIVEVDVPHYPRTAGKSSGNNLRVVLRQFRELFKLLFRTMGGGVS